MYGLELKNKNLSVGERRKVTEYQRKKEKINKARIDFPSVYKKLGALQVLMAKTFANATDRFNYKMDWVTKNILAIGIPEPEGYHAIIIHVSERRWYITPNGKFLDYRKTVENLIRKRRDKKVWWLKYARSYSLVFIGNYTKSVKGRMDNLGWTKAKKAILVFRPDRKWLTIFVNMIYNMLKSRYHNLLEALERSRFDKDKAFDVVRDYIDWFELVIKLYQDRMETLLKKVEP